MNHRVVFIVDRGQPIAVPGSVVVSKGDVITFQSVGAGHVSLLFPQRVLQTPDKEPAAAGELDSKKAKDYRVAGTPGAYSYVAFCRDVGEVAIGNSQPRIIIYQ